MSPTVQTCDSCGRTGTRGFRPAQDMYIVCVARQGACNKRVHKRFGHWLPDVRPAVEDRR